VPGSDGVVDDYAYNIYYGIAPDKLYNSVMVYDANEYWFKAMDNRKTYYFTIEAINETEFPNDTYSGAE
jgi:hypothetical protein